MPSIAVAVVIATKDRPELLQATLQATSASMRPGDELVVVDSASRDTRVGEVARRSGATVIRAERPGTCRARNLGFQAASAPVVAFTDDDCLPEPGWVEAVASAFERHADLAFLTGALVSGPGMPGDKDPGLPLSTTTTQVPRVFTAGDFAELGHGGNMAWRREALDRIGGFDEALGPGTPLRAAEDHDAFLRAIEAGLVGRFEPDAVVVHRQWRGGWGQLAAYYSYGIGSGGLFVKQVRTSSGRRRLGPGTVRFLWSRGVRPVGRAVRSGYERAAVAETMKLAGMARGLFMARRMAVLDGHLVPRSADER